MNTSHLTIQPDGTVKVALPDGDVHLRWPTVGEWKQITAAYSEANDTRDYAAAFAATIDALSTTAKPDPARLPLWADDPDIYNQLARVWLSARIDEADDPTSELTFTPIPLDDGEVTDGG